jgi:hypothetical protein
MGIEPMPLTDTSSVVNERGAIFSASSAASILLA